MRTWTSDDPAKTNAARGQRIAAVASHGGWIDVLIDAAVNTGDAAHVTLLAPFTPATGFDGFTGSAQQLATATTDFWIVHGIVTEDTTQGNCQRSDPRSTVRLSRAVPLGRSPSCARAPAPARSESGIQEGLNAL